MTAMDAKNVLPVNSRADFRAWLALHAATETECWVPARLIEQTKHGRMFGEWNDYGRLS